MATVLTVAATYVYFLIFAQFGFLKTVQTIAGGGREALLPIMAAMGLAAWVYSVAGWGGSALGIGLAEGRPALPTGAIFAAGGLILSVQLVRYFYRRPRATTASCTNQDAACLCWHNLSN